MYVWTSIHAEIREQLAGALCFHHVDLGNRTQLVRLGGKSLYPWAISPGPIFWILNTFWQILKFITQESAMFALHTDRPNGPARAGPVPHMFTLYTEPWFSTRPMHISSEISPKYLQSKDKMYRTLSMCQLNCQLLKQVSSHLSYRALEILTYFLSSYNSPAKKDVGDFAKS